MPHPIASLANLPQPVQDSFEGKAGAQTALRLEPHHGAADGVVDADRIVLRAILHNLNEAVTVIGRNVVLKCRGGKISEILGNRPDLLKWWLLELDRVNRKFRAAPAEELNL